MTANTEKDRNSPWTTINTRSARRPRWPAAGRPLMFAILWYSITGCATSPSTLEGSWTLVSIDSRPIAGTTTGASPYFRISGTSVEGHDGCNRFSGSFDEPGKIASTRMACPDATDLLPLDLNQLAEHLSNASVDADKLTVPSRGEYPESIYVRSSE